MKDTFNLTITFSSYEGLIPRIALLTERRGFNIESLAVQKGEEELSCLYLQLTGPDEKFDQICSQILKLVDVVSVGEAVNAEKRELLAISA
jgi:acetolactate synthase small subunit